MPWASRGRVLAGGLRFAVKFVPGQGVAENGQPVCVRVTEGSAAHLAEALPGIGIRPYLPRGRLEEK